MLKRVRIKDNRVVVKKVLDPILIATVVVIEYINGKNIQWEAEVKADNEHILERLTGIKYADITGTLEYVESITVVNEKMPEVIVSIWFGENHGIIVDVGV